MTARSHPRKVRFAIAALAFLAWLCFVGFVLWHDRYDHRFSSGQRALIDRSAALFAHETKLKDSKLRRLYSLTLLHRLDQSCVRFSTYRDRHGGGQYCYRDSDGRLVEERLSSVPFGRSNMLERILNAIEID